MTAPRVLGVDDHPVFRPGLRLLLEDLGMTVVGEGGDGAAAVEQAIAHFPDVVVMDLHMPGVDGVEATRRIVDAAPEVRVLVLTMADDDAMLFAALRAGSTGYLLKGAGPEQVERERDVLALLATGASNGDIARRLFLSDKTVRNDVSSIFTKLGVRDRPQAIVRAREAGLGG